MDLIKNEKGNGGIGLFGLLGVCFIVLKLTGHIEWSWIWVTAPFWGGFIFTVVVLVIMAILSTNTRRW